MVKETDFIKLRGINGPRPRARELHRGKEETAFLYGVKTPFLLTIKELRPYQGGVLFQTN